MGKRAHRAKRTKKLPSDLASLRKLFEIVSRGKVMWESTFDAIRDPVMILEPNYTILRANLAAADRAEVPIQSLIGKKCFQIFAKRKETCPRCPLKNTLRGKKPHSVPIEGLIPSKADFQVNSYSFSPRHPKSRPLVVHHYRDITEEHRLQRQLIQSERMAAIGMVAGSVAHEINNPLAGILAFTQLLKAQVPEGSEAKGDLSEIEEAAKRCKRIVEDLLIFARPHSDGGLETFQLSEAIDKILPIARLNLRHQEVTLVTEYEPDLPRVRGHSARLQQVFLNFIQNAAQSMARSGGGEVILRIRTNRERNQVLGEVIDRGCGISRESLPQIFDPFYSTKTRHQGTGLGLAICYSIVSDHGGKIEVESEVEKGSTFRVVLPAIL